MDAIENLIDAHTTAFGQEPKLAVAAPGRVNLLGGHTDYNDGYVLPMAIERVVRVTASPRPDRKMGLLALDLDERAEFDLDALEARDERHWVDYPAGVLSKLLDAGAPVTGLNLTISGDLPQGAGLASSAAMVVACGLAACELCGWSLGRKKLARLAQRAEHEFAGVLCGIMDQLVACVAEAGSVLFIDCRSLETSPVPLGGSHLQVVVTDSGVVHDLPDSAYNKRRAQCREGVAILSRRFEGQALRDFSLEQLGQVASDLDIQIEKRCRHVLTENERVLAAVQALRSGNLARFGALMYASHVSLRDLFQVSCPELDWLVDQARATPGVYGARLTGAGFGGCTVALMEQAAVGAYCQRIAGFELKFGKRPELILSQPAGAAQVLLRID